MSFCPDLDQRIGVGNLDDQQTQRLKEASMIIQLPDHEIFRILKSQDGVNAKDFVLRLDELWQQKDTETFNRLINACLLLSFYDTDILNGIVTTPALLEMIVHRAELRLVVKFISLFGRRNGFDIHFELFLDRLMNQPKLLAHYRPLFNLTKGAAHQVDDMINYREEPPQNNGLNTITNFSALTPPQLLDWIVLAHQAEPEQGLRSERDKLHENPAPIFSRIFSKRTHANIILRSMRLLPQYYAESMEVLDRHIDEHLHGETFDKAEVGEVVDFLVSKVGLEMVFPDEDNQLPPESTIMICQLFFLCNQNQLQCLALKGYVQILIGGTRICNGDAKVYEKFVLPRIVATAVCLFEKNPRLVEEEFLRNGQLVASLKSSPYALDELLCSAMLEERETIMKVLDIHPLVDQNLLDDTSLPLPGTFPTCRQSISRSSSSPSGSVRSRYRRGPSLGLTVSSEDDSYNLSSSSFTAK